MHKLTTKRQVTIPQSICQKLGLKPGDFIQVFERDGVAHLVKMTSDDLSGTIKLPGDTHQHLTREDTRKAIKNKTARKFAGES
ncbi:MULTISPECIES: AbrB/MazE/SpoVT family DNA-binding domain-containing protein [Gammaproteobacteria]|uniref:AbrB/MazE/SpoVT family DNA-binding domain-containing protein n=1 Tax=Gammaproteobacteria TaxID=1236 RepID=UPI0013D7D377|nr:AbrB/MazE/SpoVT family DNA-binding domain-containing protein [Endozoicomonas acroporae]MBO9482856.1 AbrB/MazE/SpoVT family DNA-binding domain-containing protein [Salinisphaera sp. G21_0]